MPFVPVLNTAEAQLVVRLDSQTMENTLFFQLPTDPSAADLLSLGGDLIAWWGDNIAPQVSAAAELIEIVCTSLTSDTSPSVTSVPPVAALGLVSGDFLPTNASLAVSFRTNLRGRSFRGRNYVIGLTESQVTGNHVSNVSVAAYKAAYEVLLPAGGAFTDDWAWVVVSRFHGVDVNHKPIPRTAGVRTAVTSVVIVDDVIDSQRRRLPGRGR